MSKSIFLRFFVLLLLTSSLWAAPEHATVSLQRYEGKLVVTIDHEEGWHTYWKNPGDAGLPTKFNFSLNKKPLELDASEWPIPTQYIEAGDIVTVGYSGTQHFFFSDPKSALDAHITFLICKDICIPGEARLQLPMGQQFVSSSPIRPYSAEVLKQAEARLPKTISSPEGFDYYLTRKKGENLLTLHYSLKGFQGKKLPHKLDFLTPFLHAPFGFKRETLYTEGDMLYGKMEIEWDGEYQEPPLTLPEDGQFANAWKLEFLINSPLSGAVEKIHLTVKDFTNATSALDQFYQGLTTYNSASGTSATAAVGEDKGFFQYLLFAFLGGLILNLMPCVLPVISLKLFGLIKHRNESRRRLIAHNVSYTAGVISTFLALGVVVAAIKATGEEIGWGFQLQSPSFILVMMLILFILSLNLFGLYEFYTPGGSKLGGAQVEEGLSGDFFSGILTTILATPCSAPFLGTALTFAFTTNNVTIFIMFFMIGLGLAFPFLITAIFPGSLFFFPRPGAWMEKLKYFLGLSLLATAIWLYDVFVSLVNFDAISWRLNLLFALWFFAFFFAQKISKRKILQFIAFAIPLSFTVMALQNLQLRPTTVTELPVTQSSWIPWTEEKMMNESSPVFVDFTAEWCLTCKVNKKLVMETRAFEALREKYGFVTMRADWTKRDDRITEFLRRNGSVGVPAYFIQKEGKLIPLGETLSIGKIESHLK